MAASVRDSAGIRIVENAKPQWSAETAWRIADAPSLDIGVFEGDPEYQLFRVRGAVRLTDGRVVVANAGTEELRYFGPDGTFERATGSEGGGPGEFKQLAILRRGPADSVITYDFSNRRVSLFDPAGDFARAFTVEASQGFAFFRDRLSDGTFVMSATQFGTGGRDGRFRDTATWLHYGAEGGVLDTIRRFPELEMFMRQSSGNVMVMGVPFGRSTQSATRGTHLLVGTGETFEVREYDQAGELVGIIRRLFDPIPLTAADIEHYIQTDIDRTEEENRAEVRKSWEDFPFPDTMMPYAAFRMDADGNLWVEVHEDPAARTASQYDRSAYAAQWHVFDPDGQWLGVVQMPAGFRPTDIGSDYVLGTWQDDLDVEHVQMFELIKNS